MKDIEKLEILTAAKAARSLFHPALKRRGYQALASLACCDISGIRPKNI